MLSETWEKIALPSRHWKEVRRITQNDRSCFNAWKKQEFQSLAVSVVPVYPLYIQVPCVQPKNLTRKVLVKWLHTTVLLLWTLLKMRPGDPRFGKA